VNGTVRAVAAWWYRLLDGARPWGFFDVMVGRYGLQRYRLVVFPPGINVADRRLLRLWRAWPVGGGLLAVLVAMLIGGVVAPADVTFLVAAAAYLGVGAVLFVLTAGARAGVRSMSLVLLTGYVEPDERQARRDWEKLVIVLTRADSMLHSGAIDFTQHETLWWQVYDSLEVRARV
jgi:hypothetical protein